jgi:hypothetical protein
VYLILLIIRPGVGSDDSKAATREPSKNIAIDFFAPFEEMKSGGGESSFATLKLGISDFDNSGIAQLNITPTLNPFRPPEILTQDIFDLMCSQMKHISGLANKKLIEATVHGTIQTNRHELRPAIDFADILWGADVYGSEEERARGRSRSPVRQTRKTGGNSKYVRGGAVSGDEAEDTTPSERRARSSSTGGFRNSRLMKVSQSVPPNPNASLRQKHAQQLIPSKQVSNDGGDDDDIDDDDSSVAPDLSQQLAVFNAIPSDILKLIHNFDKAGPVKGLWVNSVHPLQLQPTAYTEMTAIVHDTNLSEAKKLEWELDLLREYDEKRLDRFEAFLISRRGLAVTEQYNAPSQATLQKKAAGKRDDDTQRVGEIYYKDRGRQPYKHGL